MLKRIALCLLALMCLAGLAFAGESVVATLPADTSAITSFALADSLCAEKAGYQTVGWFIEAENPEAFSGFIDGYRDDLVAQGFTLVKEVRPKNLNAVYYFFDHPAESLTSARMNGIDFDLYLCGESSSNRMAMVMGVVPGIDLAEPAPEESWESVFAEEEPVWESVLDAPAEDAPAEELPTENVIPDFASFAQEAILSQKIKNGRETFTLEMKNLSALLEYMMVLEQNYGVSGQDGGETKYGLPMYLVLEDYEGELEPDRCTIMLGSGEKESMAGYVFFGLNEDNGQVELTVWYAMGMNPADTGDRWDGVPLEGENLEAMQQMFFEARTSGQTYPFRNDAVARYMANQLDKDVSRITWTDVRDFNELIGITITDPDLSDVENMSLTNFSVVAKSDEAIELSCLKNSEYLRILALVGGNYTGYDTLAEKKWLERVLLSAESIDDISWLENKELVRFVSIHDCSVTDFSALATLPRLEQVYLEISLSDDVSFLYGKGLDFGDTYGKPTSTFDEWYEHNWGKPGEEKKEAESSAIQAGEIVIPSLEETIGDVTLKSEEHGDLVTSYSYSFRYATACYRLMDRMAEDMIATGYYQLAKCYDVSDMRFWEMTYVGGGELEPIGYTDEGEPYHVRLTCYAAWVPAMLDYISGVSIYMNSLITYGGDYQAPAPELFSSEGAKVTVRDFASYLGGTKLVKAERGENGAAYYQYRYDYGDSVYSMVSMYEGELKATGLFETISVSRSGTSIFYYMAYIGPGAEDIAPAGSISKGEYHVQLGCANLNYASSTLTGQTFVSIRLAPDMAMAETTWAEGYTPSGESAAQEIAGFTLKFRTVQRTCLTCHGSGKCHLCNGTGVYRAYGEAVDCPKICSFCKGEKTYEAMEPYYEPN